MDSKKIVLHFPRSLVNQPIICHLVKRYDLEFNILKASVTPREEGLLVLEITGEKGPLDEGVRYLSEQGVRVQPLSQDIRRNDERCVHCGACLTACPSGALSADRGTMMIEFDSEKCIACELCVTACPVRAMDVHF